jgi:putative two-component system response regulator
MKRHTEIGCHAIINAEKMFDAPVSFLWYAREIAYTHHERCNGTGYPEGGTHFDSDVIDAFLEVADQFLEITKSMLL